MSFIDDFLKDMGGPIAEQLGKREGLNSGQTKGLLEGLAPIVLGGLKRKQEEGADVEALVNGLGGREEALDNPGGFFEGAQNLDLGAGGVLGQAKGEEAAEALAKKTGIGVGVAKKLLPMLIPLVMAYLMKKGRQDAATPDRKTGIGAILDRDGDGKILDDIAGLVIAQQMGKRGKGGFLAMIMALFGRK